MIGARLLLDAAGRTSISSVGSSDWKSSGGCSEQVAAAYRDGIGYAVRSLAEASPSTALYVDGGHGGWVRAHEASHNAQHPSPQRGVRGVKAVVHQPWPSGSSRAQRFVAVVGKVSRED